MTYIEGVDYWVRYVDFPNMAAPAVAASNGDGTFNIYINTRFGPTQQAEGLRHELEHLEREHFYRDGLRIWEIEASANGLLGALVVPPAPGPGPGEKQIRLYDSLEELTAELLSRAGPEARKRLGI